jgi:hypothetical protein
VLRSMLDGRKRDVVDDSGEFGVGGPVAADGHLVAKHGVRDG